MIANFTFTAATAGTRLDVALLAQCPTSTRAFCREACDARAVLVNGRAVPKGTRLRVGDQVTVLALAEAVDNLPAANPALPLHEVFADADLLAYDKPAAMPVQPLSRTETNTLVNAVVARHSECSALGDRPLMGGALHRIDADTSGLVLFARTAAAFAKLREQFAAQTVRKTYLALVEGRFAVGGTLENDLVHDPTLTYCRMIDVARCRTAQPTQVFHAVTAFTPIGSTRVGNEERTLLEVTIHTGVTHQIRAQLALAGMHIVNDRLYGAFAVENQVGHCLHALAAAFTHPTSGAPVEIRTPYPAWAHLP